MSEEREPTALRSAGAPAEGCRPGGPGGASARRRRAPPAPDADGARYGALATPQPVRMLTTPEGVPDAVEIDGRRRVVEAVRDDWLVQDLWWTERPVERHYHELVVAPGRIVVVYHDLLTDSWHRH